MSKHLDLGCGRFPRNPLNQSELFGVDISHLTDWCDTSYDDIDNDVERVLKIKDIISNILLNSN